MQRIVELFSLLTEDKAERDTKVEDAEANHVARQHLVKDDHVRPNDVERSAKVHKKERNVYSTQS